jgi:hypothetical protein
LRTFPALPIHSHAKIGSALRQLVSQSDNAVDVIIGDVADHKHLESVFYS